MDKLLLLNRKVVKKAYIKPLKPKEVVETTREALVLVQLDHPYIIKYFESFADDEYFYIIEEYCEGGDLWTKMQNYEKISRILNEEEIVIWFSQLVLAFLYLHGKDILHRDIKSLNIFIQSNKLKVGDFGLAKNMEKNAFAMTMVGTSLYFCPELCRNEPYNTKSDMWALGVLLFEMCTYGFPFDSFDGILKQEAPDLPSRYSINLNKLYKSLLEKRPENRFSIKQAKRFLEERLSVEFDIDEIRIETNRSISERKSSRSHRTPSNSLSKSTRQSSASPFPNSNERKVTFCSPELPTPESIVQNLESKHVKTLFNEAKSPTRTSDRKSTRQRTPSNSSNDQRPPQPSPGTLKITLDHNNEYKSQRIKTESLLPQEEPEEIRMCFICKKQIKDNEKVFKSNKNGFICHKSCRNCKNCKSRGELLLFKETEGCYYCPKCDLKLFGNKCFICKKEIECGNLTWKTYFI